MKLRYLFPTLCCVVLLILSGCASGGPKQAQAQWHNVPQPEIHKLIDASGKPLTIHDVAARCLEYDVVFFGENHGNYQCHTFERDLLLVTAKLTNGQVAVCMEMFERDQQPVLDAYLAGSYREIGPDRPYKQFVNAMPKDARGNPRMWGNAESDYMPTVDYCRKKGIPVIAGFPPRFLASKIFREGQEAALAGMTEEERAWIASDINTQDGPYKDRFLSFFTGGGDHGGATELDDASRQRFNNMFAAQCVKDDTMAEQIVTYKDAKPNHLVLGYCGAFHSDYGLGAVERLKLRRPNLKVLIISTQPENQPDASAGDILLLIKTPQSGS